MITIDFKRLGLTAGDRILDIGCGSGRHVGEAARYNDVFVVGADRRVEDLNACRERLDIHDRLGECRGRWQLMTADLLDLPFANESFDLVICSEVLEHIERDDAAAAELNRVLKPGKNLAVSVPRWYPERICWALSQKYRSASGGHVRIYRRKDVVKLFRNRGLTPWASHYAHSLHTPFWWLKCLLGPEGDPSRAVRAYHQFLVWDMLERPATTRRIDTLLNPVMGKSLVIYLKKGPS